MNASFIFVTYSILPYDSTPVNMATVISSLDFTILLTHTSSFCLILVTFSVEQGESRSLGLLSYILDIEQGWS